MNRRNLLLLLVVLAILTGGLWLFFHAPDHDEDAAAEAKVHATVQTAPLHQGVLEEKITAFGAVTSSAADAVSVSVPFEGLVSKVLVSPGEQVQKDTSLLVVDPSPATLMELKIALGTKETADRALAQTQQRFDLKLAVNADLDQARQAASEAALKLASLQTSGQREIKAAQTGIVGDLSAKVGQVIAAGASLLEISSLENLEARVGVEPEEAPRLSVGAKVSLTFVQQSAGKAIEGVIRLITRRINPQTRLVDVFITLPPETSFLLNGPVQASLPLTSPEGLLAPREAIVTGGEGEAVFTIKDGQAVRHAVQVEAENDTEARITADDLHFGDMVITAGAYEAEDGMSVSTGDISKEATKEP